MIRRCSMHRRVLPVCLKLALAITLALIIVIVPAMAVMAAILYERWEGPPSVGPIVLIYEDVWIAQQFTAESDHPVTAVELFLFGSGNTGPLTVSIREVDSYGYPTGSDLTWGTIDGNQLPPWLDPAWQIINFTTPYNITSGTKYAIVIRTPATIYPEYVEFPITEDPDPNYPGGILMASDNGGASFNIWLSNKDILFRIYGEEPVGGELYPVNKLSILAPWLTLALFLAMGAGILVVRRRQAHYS